MFAAIGKIVIVAVVALIAYGLGDLYGYERGWAKAWLSIEKEKKKDST